MKKNIIEFCMVMLGVLIIALGGFLIWHILFYTPPPPLNLSIYETCLLVLSFGLACGFAFHGVHPILLVKLKK